MHAILVKAAIGALVGVLVGLTGMGSGVLLLPVLIFGLGVPPIIAIGSDAAFSALTKLGAGFLHWRNGTVNWKLTQFLALGSVPGALGGVLLLSHLRTAYGSEVNNILRSVVGLLLVCIPLLLLFPVTSKQPGIKVVELTRKSWIGISLIGLFAGFLVGMSSVGSGTIILVMLVPLIKCQPSILVGTDIVHAVILTSFTSFLYMRLGTVDFTLLLALLFGSIPGALLGVRLSTILPSQWLKRVLCVTLLITGVRILWV
ncbi:MAG TPA: sulfite exporter TauE/SafE family protein [Bryobacteraceae bacterium]|nr:sulfite exporter TauE/SafE family protein [Bryobacteraceae bacterium]